MKKRLIIGFLFVILVFSLMFVTSCQNDLQTPTEPETGESTVVLSKSNPAIQAVMAVQDRHTPDLMSNPEVVGTATGLTEDGRPAIMVYTKSEAGTAALKKGMAIPQSIEGIPVVVEVTGVIRPMKIKVPPVSHTDIQTPPIQLGVSGGWKYDLANGYCCGGTLGSLIKVGNTQYILSNYHVLVADIVAGGNNRVATNGDPVIQPGLIDVGCNASLAQEVATLAFVNSPTLPGHNIDAAVAQVISGVVRSDGAILEIGTLSATTAAAYINQPVKKSGRTTGLTRSTISGLNGTISVAYDNECAGGAAFTKTYTGQIIINNKRSAFLDSGDSGSLMVEDVSTNPKAIGLLFAGSRLTAIANPIDDVLTFYGATMVGN